MCVANGVQLSHFISQAGEGSNPSQDAHAICSIPLNFITHLVQKRKHSHWMDIFNPSIIYGFTFHWCKLTCLPIPVAMRSKTEDARLLGMRIRFPPVHGCLSSVSVVFYQVEVTASSYSLVQWNPSVLCLWVWSWSLDNEEPSAH